MRALALALLASPAMADAELYAADNVLATFYHELGHAIVDLGLLPVLGQEEDAADALSVVLIDSAFDEEDALALMGSVVDMWAVSAAEGAPVYHGAHDPDIRRRFSHICLFAGADLEARGDWAVDSGLPEERLEACEEEFALAAESWGAVLDEMAGRGGMTFEMRAEGAAARLAGEVLAAEVAALNDELALPRPLSVAVEACGEQNAFYDPAGPEIVVCAEYAAWFLETAPN